MGSEMKGKEIWEQDSGLEYNELRQCLFEQDCAWLRNQFRNTVCIFATKFWFCFGDVKFIQALHLLQARQRRGYLC